MSLPKAIAPMALKRSIPALPSLASSTTRAMHSSATSAPQSTRQPQILTGGKHRRLVTQTTTTTPSRQPQTISQAHFQVVSKPGFHGQTEVELNLHGILDRLRTVLGDVPYGRSEKALSRTPLRVLPAVNPQVRGSTITFKVFNGQEELLRRVAEELKKLPGVERVEIAES